MTPEMIAFASCIASPAVFAQRALAGLREVAEPDSPVAELATATSIFAAYNEALDHFATLPELEALVLLHEDTELVDPAFCARVRDGLADPAVAILGAVGARGVRSLAWWDGEQAGAITETRGRVDVGFGRPEVDAVDGLLLVLSPWAVRTLRFDERSFTGFHGYDVDVCFAARAAGREVRVADLPAIHHTEGGYGDRAAWDVADETFRRKWGPFPGEAPATAQERRPPTGRSLDPPTIGSASRRGPSVGRSDT
jgi:hypothetical protein